MSRNMKSKLMIISPLIVIIGLISFVLTHSVLNPTTSPAQTTPTEPQTTTPIHLLTTIVQEPATKTIYSNNTPPAIPTELAAEVSIFSHGIRLDVGVNDTTPRVGGAVLVVVQISNVNSSDPVGFFYDSVYMEVLNSEGIGVWACQIWYSRTTITTITPGYVELTLNQSYSQRFLWIVEPYPNSNIKIKPGESYYIVASWWFRINSEDSIQIQSDPIRVEIRR